MIAFRVQDIPPECSWEELALAIAESHHEAEASVSIITGTLLPAPDPSLKSQVAVIQFSSAVPVFLKPVMDDKTGETTAHLRVNGTDLRFDKNFWGMTPLFYPDPVEDVSMDIVAVTGLDGNAYGSWASRDVNVMWLRDYLKDDMPKCRVLTFGYNTKLTINNNYRFEDFCKELLSQLSIARSSDTASYRPLVLVGHSYGTKVIAQSLCRCKRLDDPDLNAILTATCAVVFFGAVHRGMDTSDIEEYLRDAFPDKTASLKMVQQLSVDNDLAMQELQHFIDLFPRFPVISIYERRQSRQLVKQVTESGNDASENSTSKAIEKTWKRVGEPYTPITEHSALLGLPTGLEISIPSDTDHSSIPKFSHRSDNVYREVLKHLRRIEAEIDLNAFPYTPLLRAKPLSASTLLRAATNCMEELISDTIFSEAESELLDEADAAIRTARYHLILLDKAGDKMELDVARRRQSRTVVLKLRQLLADLIGALELASSHPDLASRPPQLRHATLPSSIVRTLRVLIPALGDLNGQLERLTALPVKGSRLLSTLVVPNMKAGMLARMATAWGRDGRTREGASVEWVPFGCLHFPVGSVPEDARDSVGWVQRVVRFFTEAEAKTLRLRARRFGVLDRNGRLEKVMVEFRPYPSSIQVGNQQVEAGRAPPAAADEYQARKWALASLARMLLWSEVGPQTPGSRRFPCVPFRCLSDMSASSTPSFALVFSAGGLYALPEIMQRQLPFPSIAQRVELALSYARALAALHTADIVHGGFNTDNLFLQFPGSEGGTRPPGMQPITVAEALLAGFETARSLGGMTDKLDVEDPDLRAYVHPDRLAPGSTKNRQQPAYDVFGLGMVLTEIGRWELLRSLPGYPQPWQSDSDRQRFCRSQRHHFAGDTTPENLGSLYAEVIAFCFGKGPDPLIGHNTSRPSDDDSQAAWKTLRVVELIQECTLLVSGSPTVGISE